MTMMQVPLDDGSISALLRAAAEPFAALVLAHGAGAGMHHPFMEAAAEGLAARGVTTLRYQFPFMDAGSKRPDRPALAQHAVRRAVDAAAAACSGLPLFAGGKSFGGRMTSQAQAEMPLPGVRGLVFFGFPLHAAGKPTRSRADHLAYVMIPMLFLQGTRDTLADLALLDSEVAALGARATLVRVEDADHSFHVRARSGRTDGEAMTQILDAGAAWMRGVVG